MKYIAKPNISIEVVINGPEANAGLNPNLLQISLMKTFTLKAELKLYLNGIRKDKIVSFL